MIRTALAADVLLRDVVANAVLQIAQELVEEVDVDQPDPGPRAVPATCGSGWRGCGCWRECRSATWSPTRRCCRRSRSGSSTSTAAGPTRWSRARVSVGTVTTADRAAAREPLPGGPRRGRRGRAAGPAARLGARRGGAGRPGRARSPASCCARGWSPAGRRCTCARTHRQPGLTPTIPTAIVAESDARGPARLLRLERLAPAVLLVLFDGVPAVVHIEEPRAGVQFGVDETGGRERPAQARVTLRDATTGDRSRATAGRRRRCRCRSGRGAPGVDAPGDDSRRACSRRDPAPTSARRGRGGVRHADAAVPVPRGVRRPDARPAASLPPDAVFRPTIGLAALPERFERQALAMAAYDPDADRPRADAHAAVERAARTGLDVDRRDRRHLGPRPAARAAGAACRSTCRRSCVPAPARAEAGVAAARSA